MDGAGSWQVYVTLAVFRTKAENIGINKDSRPFIPSNLIHAERGWMMCKNTSVSSHT